MTWPIQCICVTCLSYTCNTTHAMYVTAPHQSKIISCKLQRTATHCNALQRTVAHCNALQHTATHCTHCITLLYTATHRHAMHHTAIHCITLQCRSTHFMYNPVSLSLPSSLLLYLSLSLSLSRSREGMLTTYTLSHTYAPSHSHTPVGDYSVQVATGLGKTSQFWQSCPRTHSRVD